MTFHWSAAEWAGLIALARLGLETERWKAAAELALAGERGRAQELAAAQRMRADVVDRLTAYQVGVAAIVADDSLTSGAVRGQLAELLGARMAPIAGPHFDVVFDGPPGPEAGRFVEVEDDQGRGISIGHWVPPAKGAEHYPMQPPKVDEFWRLRITRAEVLARMPAPAEPATSDARVSHDPAGGWAEVTRQLGERVARLEAERKLLDNRAAVEAADRMVFDYKVDMGPICPVTGIYASRCTHCGAEPLNGEVAEETRVSAGGELDRVSLDRVAARAGVLPDQVTVHVVGENASKPRLSFADIGKSPGFQQVATEGLMRDFVRTDRYLKQLLGPEEYEVMQRRLIQGGPRITSEPEVSPALFVQREADLQEAARTVDGLRAQLLEAERQLANARAEELETRASKEAIAIRVRKLEVSIADAAKQLCSLVGDSRPCALTEAVDRVQEVLDKTRANLGPRQDGETLQAQAGRIATALADLVIKHAEVHRQLDVEHAARPQPIDGAHINLAMEAETRAKAQRDAALAALASIAYMLHVERGATVGETRDRIVAKLDEMLASKMATDHAYEMASAGLQRAESKIARRDAAKAKPDDLARRIRESDFIQGLEEQQGDHDWLREQTDGDLLDHVFARLNHVDRLEDQIRSVNGLTVEAGMMADGTLRERVAAAIERARTEGRREADLERAALVAKLQLVREVCGVNASLDAPGGDNVVERVRALADRFGQVCEALKTEDAAHVVDEVRALVESEARWEEAHAARTGELNTERKLHAETHRLLGQSNADHNALLTHLQRIRTALRIEIDEPWSIVVDRVIGCVNVAASKPLDRSIAAGDPGRFAEGIVRVLDERRGEIASGLSPVPGIPSRRPLPLAAEQILRDVIEAANASGFTKLCDVFEVRHRPADAKTPPRAELHVFAGKEPTTATSQVLAYVELGQLYLISLNGEPQVGSSGYARESNVMRDYRWPDRIRAALDRK